MPSESPRPGTLRRPSHAARLAGRLLLVPFPLAVTLIATVHPWPRALVALVAAGVGLFALARTPRAQGPGPRVLLSIGVLAFAWLTTALAFIPVGPAGRAALQPGIASRVDAALALADASTHTLALAPDRALVGWGFAAAMILLAMGVATVVHTRRRSLRLAASVVLTAVALVGVAALERWTGAASIWWVTGIPTASRDLFFGTFVNPNHGGAALAAAFPLGVALAARGTRTGRIGWAAALVLLAAGLWATHSRGALLEVGTGLLAMVLVTSTRKVRLALLGAVGVAAATVMGAGLRQSAEWLTARLTRSATMPDVFGNRVANQADAWSLVRAAPWVGVGPGGFADGFTMFKTLPRLAATTHAHNEPLQALAEHGVPIAMAWFVAMALPLLWAVLHAASLPPGRRRTLGAGWLGAAAALLTATIFDFPLRIGALAVLAALVGGACLGFAGNEQPPANGRAQMGSRVVGFLLAAAALLVPTSLALGRLAPDSDLAPVQTVLARADIAWDISRGLEGEERTPELERSTDEARKAIRRRPASTEGILRLARAQLGLRHLDDTLATLEIASEIHPTLYNPWLIRARILAWQGEDAESRAAWKALLALNLPDNDDAEPYVSEALRLQDDPAAVVWEIVPERADRLRLAGHWLAERGDREVSRQLFGAAVALDPRSALMFANHLLRWEDPAAAWAMVQQVPDRNCGTMLAGGQALLDLGRLVEATDWFEQAVAACGTDDRRASLGLARALGGRGNVRALSLYARLLEQEPDNASLHHEYADVLRNTGRIDLLRVQLHLLVDTGEATAQELVEMIELEADGLPE